MTNDNYILIQGWMINSLKLKGNSLMLFALIYGFSQDGTTEFKGSSRYMCASINASKPTLLKSIKELLDKGLINKRVEEIDGVIFNRYSVNLGGVKKLYRGGKETLQGGGKETLPNNTNIDNIEDNNNSDAIDFPKLLIFISEQTGRGFRVINDKVKKKYKGLIKQGYSKEDIINAIKNAVKEKYHLETNFRYLTPEFFSRPDIIDKYSFNNKTKKQDVKTPIENIDDGLFQNF